MRKIDRRAQRTKELLQNNLIALIHERGYENITIQDIVSRANIGRSTFYLHYNSKDELFISCHRSAVSEFDFRILYSLSSEELMSAETPQGVIAAFRHLQDEQRTMCAIFQNKESLQKMREWNSQYIETVLRSDFSESETLVPFAVLANYLAGAQLSFLQWWLEKRRPYAPEKLAQIFHRLQRAAIREALSK